MHSQRGFSLIEAMVALVILASASLALFGWINTSLNQLNRAEFYNQSAPALKSMTEYLQIVDLTARPTGTFAFGDINIDWQATPVSQDTHKIAQQGSGNFYLSLYDVELTLKRQQQSLPPFYTRVVKHQLKPGAGANPFGI